MNLSGLIDVIHWLEKLFERFQMQRSYDGAIAYNYYAPPRLTQHVEVLALVPDSKIPELLDEFSTGDCQHLSPEPRPLELTAVLADFRGKAHLAVIMLYSRFGVVNTTVDGLANSNNMEGVFSPMLRGQAV